MDGHVFARSPVHVVDKHAWIPTPQIDDSSTWVSPPLGLLTEIHRHFLDDYDCDDNIHQLSQDSSSLQDCARMRWRAEWEVLLYSRSPRRSRRHSHSIRLQPQSQPQSQHRGAGLSLAGMAQSGPRPCLFSKFAHTFSVSSLSAPCR